jgi:predicted transcriptional regulator
MRITDAESRIMEVLWRRSPLGAEQLIAAVRSESDWGEATVKTLINRLLKKGALGSERVEGRHAYRPLVERSAYVEAESQSLLSRLFGGEVSPLIAHFAEHRKLTAADRERLKALIETLDDE